MVTVTAHAVNKCRPTVKKRRVKRALNDTPSHIYGVSLAIRDHRGLPATQHKWIYPVLTPARQAGTQFTYPRGMEGWVDLGDRLHTKMVYPPQTVTHPSTSLAVHGWELIYWVKLNAPPDTVKVIMEAVCTTNHLTVTDKQTLRMGVELATCWLQVRRPNHYAAKIHWHKSIWQI